MNKTCRACRAHDFQPTRFHNQFEIDRLSLIFIKRLLQSGVEVYTITLAITANIKWKPFKFWFSSIEKSGRNPKHKCERWRWVSMKTGQLSKIADCHVVIAMDRYNYWFFEKLSFISLDDCSISQPFSTHFKRLSSLFKRYNFAQTNCRVYIPQTWRSFMIGVHCLNNCEQSKFCYNHPPIRLLAVIMLHGGFGNNYRSFRRLIARSRRIHHTWFSNELLNKLLDIYRLPVTKWPNGQRDRFIRLVRMHQ